MCVSENKDMLVGYHAAKECGILLDEYADFKTWCKANDKMNEYWRSNSYCTIGEIEVIK